MESVSVKLRMQLKDFIASLAETTKTEKSVEQRMKEVKSLKLNLTELEQKQQDRAALPFDASRIRWEDRESEKGRFQMSEDSSNPEHRALLKFLGSAGGCIDSRDSGGRLWFYWTYRNGSTIGRKLRLGRTEAKEERWKLL